MGWVAYALEIGDGYLVLMDSCVVFPGSSKGYVCRLRKEVVRTEAAMTAAGRSGTTHVRLGIILSMFYLFPEHLNTLSR